MATTLSCARQSGPRARAATGAWLPGTSIHRLSVVEGSKAGLYTRRCNCSSVRGCALAECRDRVSEGAAPLHTCAIHGEARIKKKKQLLKLQDTAKTPRKACIRIQRSTSKSQLARAGEHHHAAGLDCGRHTRAAYAKRSALPAHGWP